MYLFTAGRGREARGITTVVFVDVDGVSRSGCAMQNDAAPLDSLRGSSVKIGTIQRILAWPLRKDDTHQSRSAKRRRTTSYT